MAKIQPIRIYHEAVDGTEFEMSVEVTVTSDGVFRVAIPDELRETMDVLISLSNRPVGIIGLDRSRGTVKIESRDVESARKLLVSCAKALLEVETTSERLIAYFSQSHAGFWLTTEGEIHGHGAMGHAGRWWASRFDQPSSSDDKFQVFSVGMGAAVYDKVTYKRATGDRVMWNLVRADPEHRYHDEMTPLELLNSFGSMGRISPEHFDVKLIPYSDKAALFFHKAIVGLCKSAKAFDDFLGDDQMLALAIEKCEIPQLGFSQ